MNRKTFAIAFLIVLAIASSVFAQDKGNDNSADSALRGSGRVNPSTLGMEFQLSLGSYAGRGINVPINLSYSSKVWRMESGGISPDPNSIIAPCLQHYFPRFADKSASGWTTSLATPYIEYVGAENIYNYDGTPNPNRAECPSSLEEPAGTYPQYFIRRLIVHLPSGETHELRPNDVVEKVAAGVECPSASTACSRESWNRTYYAVDGSNLRFVQDSTATTPLYRLQMPDGSYYDFDATIAGASERKATKYSDRNGNHTTYIPPDIVYPNGRWIDTLGRTLAVPLGVKPPTTPTAAGSPQEYSLPGMTGKYKFHWKQLKGGTAAESAISDFNQTLKYIGDKYVCQPGNQIQYCTTPGTWLFFGGYNARIVNGALFNPVLLKEIELPTGQKYKFAYDLYGRLNRIEYPTGGVETFTYNSIPTLNGTESEDDVSAQTNFGVANRKVYRTAADTSPYEWNYSAAYESLATGYKVSITNPDGTRAERYLIAGNGSNTDVGRFGYDEALAGMAYDERGYDAANHMLSRMITTWQRSEVLPTSSDSIGFTTPVAHWNPRVKEVQSFAYDTAGNGVSSTSKFEYENETGLTTPGTPLLQSKSSEYAFVVAGAAVPTTPIRTSETTYLINDSSITQSTRDAYIAQNMVGLATASVVKDSAGTIVSRKEMKYDESGYSPAARGNATTARVWDSTKGAVTNTNAYIQTRARFDGYGNQYESIDAKGNVSTTTYETTHNAFPVSTSSAIPDPTGVKGSSTAFTTTVAYNYVTGLPLKTSDANGIFTTIEYDAATLRPRFAKKYNGDPDNGGVQIGGTVETVYNDEPGNLWVKNRSQIDTDNWKEVFTYFDALGRAYKTEEVNSHGNIFTEKEFDPDGRVSRVCNPYRAGETKKWTTNVYDDASRVIEVVLQDGSKVKTDYGVSATGLLGITKTITDQAGKKRKGISDALGRMVRVIEDPAGAAWNTDYVFDTLGNLRQTTQGVQNRYFTYDSLGRILFAKQPEQDAYSSTGFTFTDSVTSNSQWSVKYEYDDNGNITKTTDARGVYVQGTYDALNRLVKRDYSDDTPDVDFWYDGKGLPTVPARSKGKTTRVSSSISENRYTSFNDFGELLTSEQRTPFTAEETVENATPRTSSYEYDSFGRLLTQTYPSGRKVNFDYDSDGVIADIRGSANSINRLYLNGITYNAAGQMTRMRLGNGKWESTVYNDRMQVTQIGLGNSAADQSLLKLEYDYGTSTENNGSLRSQKISFAGLSQPFEQTYTYDDLNRIHSAEEKVGTTSNWKQTFVFDRYGNRTLDAANTTTLAANNAVTNPSIETAKNRLNGYSYDTAGNVTVDAENQRFVYDAENHQTKLFGATNNSTTPDAIYQYDGEGRRVKKISSLESTVFVYDGGGQQIAEYTAFIASNPAPAAQISYLTADHLGSPRVITNQNGQVISRKDYMAYGDEVPVTKRTGLTGYDQAQETRKGYTGYEKDVESGVEFAQARYYNARVGRFTSIDPLTASANIKDPQTFNRYTYVLNSPYRFTDSLGLKPSKPTGQPVYNQELADFLDNNMVDASESQSPSYRPRSNPGDSNSSAGHGISGGSQGGSSNTAQTAEAPESPPAPEQNGKSEASLGELDGIDISMVYSVSTGKLKIIITKPVYGLEDKVWTEEFSGTSGTENCINNPDCANDTAEHKDQGPIPLGNYTLNSAEISDLTGISVAKVGKVVLTGIRGVIDTPSVDWGSFRVPLNPDSQLKFRSGFFLHGGSFPGSRGCIDVGVGEYGNKATERIQSLIKADGGKAIPLKVIK